MKKIMFNIRRREHAVVLFLLVFLSSLALPLPHTYTDTETFYVSNMTRNLSYTFVFPSI